MKIKNENEKRESKTNIENENQNQESNLKMEIENKNRKLDLLRNTLSLISKITNDNTIKDIVDDTLNGK